jgi:hypothetical protein
MSEQPTKKFTFQYTVISRHFVQADSVEEARMELNFQTISESDFTLAEVAAIWDEVAEEMTGEAKAIYHNPLVSMDEGRTIKIS